MKRDLVLFAGLVAAVAAAAGCNQPTYLQETRPLETTMAMGGGYAGDTDTFVLPVRAPTVQEQAALMTEQMKLGLQQPVPWIGVRDMPVEVQYTLKNLEDREVTVNFTLGGGNEFGTYDPLLFYDPNDPEAIAPPPLAGTTPIHLAANETRSLVFREDQIAESAVDIEAIVRFPSMPALSTPFKVLNSRSDVNRIGLETVPANNVTPQQLVLQFNLTADGHVMCNYVVRTRDLKGRLAPPGTMSIMLPDLGMYPDMYRGPFQISDMSQQQAPNG
jgi:hypothetical protein